MGEDEFEKFFDSITPAGSYDAHDPTHRALRYTQEIAWRAGREHGMREAARIADGVEAEFLRESTLPDLTGTYSKHCGACASGAGSVEVAILAAIEGKK